jgi:hypothetical protein
MEDAVIPFQIERGMTIIGSWVDRDQPDRCVWLRRFESEEQHEALGKAVYEDPRWASEFRPHIDEMLDVPGWWSPGWMRHQGRGFADNLRLRLAASAYEAWVGSPAGRVSDAGRRGDWAVS